MIEQGTYKCGACLRMLTVDNFYFRKKGRQAGARITRCKACTYGIASNWNKENPDARKSTVFKYDEAHRERNREYCRKRRSKQTDDEKRAPHLKRMFGITISGYNELLLRQGGTCALCPATTARPSGGYLCVDHDHTTGAIRGLLCAMCNTAIGLLGDDPKRIREAADYVDRHLINSTDNALTRMMAGA